MQTTMTFLIRSILLASLALLTACGGGGGSGDQSAPAPVQQATAVLMLSASGTPSAALAGIGVKLELPAGVTPALDVNGDLAASVVTVSGAAVPGTSLAYFMPATATQKGTLTLAVASSMAAGFGAGEFATVTLQIAKGTTVSQSDFALAEFSPISLTGTIVQGLTPSLIPTFQ